MRKTLSVAIITLNEEENLERTLRSIGCADEIVVVDSGSTDLTAEIATAAGARFYTEEWKGFAAQKNSAIDKCSSDWILSLDADESLTEELNAEIRQLLQSEPPCDGYALPRRNLFLGRWIRFGGFYPDRKLRLFRRGTAEFENRLVHETLHLVGQRGRLNADLVHHAYPTLESYIAHMDRYSSLAAQQAAGRGKTCSSLGSFTLDIVANPLATFFYNYLFRLGFLDGREGFLLHWYHSVYVSWKYAKAWELSRDFHRKS
jgi:glycosyltransferase involved in cell wall biosynthesis